MLKLNQVMANHAIRRSDLAGRAGLSRTAVSQLVNHGVYPASRPQADVRRAVQAALIEMGVDEADAAGAFKKSAGCRGPIHIPPNKVSPDGESQERGHMLIRKISLNAHTLEFFKLARDPFTPPQTREAVFMGRALRVGFEHMKTNAYFGGLLAIIGESGAGKSTIKHLLLDDLAERAEVVVIEPMIIGMDENDTKGTTLKASHIADAILREVAPYERPKRTLEARGHQIRDALARAVKDNSKRHHLLVIEEAHRLPVATLKHLKNFYELKAGSRQLLSVLLLGQPELARRLSPFDHEIREVWQRCQIEMLEPLGKQLPDYVKFRLGSIASPFQPDAFESLTTLLTDPATERSYLYPLAVDNWTAAAMNVAARIGASKITAQTIDATRAQLAREYRGA